MARPYQDYAEKVVVITGASAGIGAALAEEIARRGGRLVLVARRREKLDEVARKCGGAEVVVGDVTRREDVERALQAAVARHGHVDVWVNNAGRGISKPLLALTDEDVDVVFRDNLKSALYGMQVVLPHFQARNAGVLVNVSSMLSRVPYAPIRSAYSAAKAALDSITETARIELAKDFPGVRIVLVLPGVVATDFGLNAIGGGPDSRSFPGAQDVDEVARVMADGMMSGRSDVYTRPEGLDMVLGHLKTLAGTPRA